MPNTRCGNQNRGSYAGAVGNTREFVTSPNNGSTNRSPSRVNSRSPRRRNPSSSRSPIRNPIPVDQLDKDLKTIGRYIGNEEKDVYDITQHFSNIEARGEVRHWTENQQLYVARMTFTGIARGYLKQQDEDDVDNYEKLKSVMIHRFDSCMNTENLKSKLNSLTQGSGTIKKFVQEIRSISEKISSRTGKPVSTDHLMTILQRGVQPHYHNSLQLLRLTNFEDAVGLLIHLEDGQSVRQGPEFPFNYPNVNSMQSDQLAMQHASVEQEKKEDKTMQEILKLNKMMVEMMKKNEEVRTNQHSALNNEQRNSFSARGRGRGNRGFGRGSRNSYNYNYVSGAPQRPVYAPAPFQGTVPPVICYRCSRVGHIKSRCYAKFHENGTLLPPVAPQPLMQIPLQPYQVAPAQIPQASSVAPIPPPTSEN